MVKLVSKGKRTKKGRSSVVTQRLMDRICERIAGGETIRQIASDETMPAASTMYLAFATNFEFSEQYARAREAQLMRWEDELLEIADDATNDWMERRNDDDESFLVTNHEHISRSKVRIDARKWLMAKRAPKKYGDKVSQELSGPDGAPVRTEVKVMIDEETEARIAARLLGE